MKINSASFLAADYSRVRLPDSEVIRLTGCSRTTAAHWRTGKHPPPPAAVSLVKLAYFGELGAIWPAFDGFRVGMDGRLYIPYFRYGFKPAELLQWHRMIQERDELHYRLKIAENDLARAESALAVSEARRAAEIAASALESQPTNHIGAIHA